MHTHTPTCTHRFPEKPPEERSLLAPKFSNVISALTFEELKVATVGARAVPLIIKTLVEVYDFDAKHLGPMKLASLIRWREGTINGSKTFHARRDMTALLQGEWGRLTSPAVWYHARDELKKIASECDGVVQPENKAKRRKRGSAVNDYSDEEEEDEEEDEAEEAVSTQELTSDHQALSGRVFVDEGALLIHS